MKKIILFGCLLVPVVAYGYCNVPTMGSNQYLNQQLQNAYQNCLNNERNQQQQLQLQQQQLQVQQQQLQLQQQQQQSITPSQPNYNLLRPINQQ